MAANVIESYLVGIGFSVDLPEMQKFNGTLADANKAVEFHTSGILKSMLEWQGAITGAYAAVGLGIVGMVDHVANADQNYRLLGQQMFMTQDRARTMKIAMDALGETMEQIAWDPESNRRYVQLIEDQERLGKALGMGNDYEKQMEKIRDIRQEFTRLEVATKYLAMGFVERIFEKMGGGPDALQHKLEWLNNWIQGNAPKIAGGLADNLLPVLNAWKKIMVDTGGALEDVGLTFTNLVGALAGDDSIEGTTFSFKKMATAVGDVAHWFGEVVDDVVLAERMVLHFVNAGIFGIEALNDKLHGNSAGFTKYWGMMKQEDSAALKDITPGSGSVAGAMFGGVGGGMAAGMAAGAVGGPLGMLLGAGAGGLLGAANGALEGHLLGKWVNGPGEHGMGAGPLGHIGGGANPAIHDAITAAAVQYSLDPSMLHAQATEESGERQWNKDGSLVQSHDKLTGKVLATGVMQLMPSAASDLGVDATDPMQNIQGGSRLMAQLMARYSNDETKALEAYNWGPAKLDKALATGGRIPADVQQYASGIEERARQLTINGGITVHVSGTNLSHEQVAKAVTDGVMKAQDRATQNDLAELAGSYH